jgi:hypothetical protein
MSQYKFINSLIEKHDIPYDTAVKIFNDFISEYKVYDDKAENDKLKNVLLAEAAKKEPHCFYQYDGFANSTLDCVFNPDEDGDCLFGGTITTELKNCTNAVRVLIHEDAKPEEVIRLLKKIRKWIKQDPYTNEPAPLTNNLR